MRSRRRLVAVALALLFAGAVVRVGLAAAVPVRPAGDPLYYLHAAASIARGQGVDYRRPHWAGTHWPPGQPAFLALFARRAALSRPSRGPLAYPDEFHLDAARLVTATLSVVGLGLLALAGRRLFDAPTGLLAAGLVAVYPNAIGMSHLLNAESNFLVLLGLALWLAARAGAPAGGAPRPARSLLAGAAFGAAAYWRSIGLVLALPFAFRALAGPGSRRARALAAAALGAGALLVVAPWTVRNALRYDRFLLLDTSGGETMYLGNNDFPPMTTDYKLYRRAEGGRPRCRLPNPVDNFRCEVSRGLAHIAAHPAQFASRVVSRAVALANPSSLTAKHALRGAYGAEPPRANAGAGARVGSWERAVAWLCAGSFLLLAVAALAGLAGAAYTPDRVALAAGAGLVLALPAALQAETRYRLAALPAAALFAAHAIVHARAVLPRLRRPARAAAFAAGVAWLAAGVWRYGWTLV